MKANKLSNLTGRAGSEHIRVQLSVSWLTECVIYITLICNFFILLGKPLHNNVMVSLATRTLLFSVLLTGSCSFLSSITSRVDAWAALYVGLLFSSVMLGLLNGVDVYTGKLVNVICFYMLPIYMISSRLVVNVSRIKKVIYAFSFLYTLVFIYLYLSGYAYVAYNSYGQFVSEDLTLGYDNPNETAMYLLVCYMIMLVAFVQEQNKSYRACIGILAAVLLFFILLAGSRMSIILVLIFTLAFLFKLYERIGRKIQNIVVLLPFASIILMLIFPDFFAELTILGEAADTGRYGLYINALDSLTFFSFLGGNLKTYAGHNLHNSYLTIIITYGVIVFCFYFALLKTTLSRLAKQISSKPCALAHVAVLVIVLHGMAEGTFLVAGTVYAGLVGLLFILMREEAAVL